jgi:uncharacterized membrane protein YkoI
MSLSKNEQGIAHVIALVFALVLVAVGSTGYYVMKHQNSKTKNSEAVALSASTTLAAPLPTTLLPVDKVKELVVAQKQSSTILGVELENENGVLLYKVKLADGTSLSFNAQSGALVANAVKSEIDGQTTLPSDTKATINFVKARSIAMNQMPKATVQKIELELEDGILIYSVRFTDGSRVDVNATDGSVIKTKVGNHGTLQIINKSDDKSSSSSSASSTSSDNKSSSTGHTTTSTDSSVSHDSTETHDAGTPSSTSGSSSVTTTEDSSLGGNSSSGTSGSGSSGRH